jgi:undecaprenyl-phosphate 4-deoxy-4-formamido-L-arabinose transferase
MAVERVESEATAQASAWPVDNVSIVVPVYRGAASLGPLLGEIAPLVVEQRTPQGYPFRVVEVLLIHDDAVDDSATVMESLAKQYPFVRSIWLSRNYGQHPATLAGMASTSSEWIVTLDEDGQHAPMDIGKMLDRAHETGSQLVYATGLNQPPHSFFRNVASKLAKRLFRLLVDSAEIGQFNSFRLVWGETGRSLAAYCGNGIYLDVALSWVVPNSVSCPVILRSGTERQSGYDFSKLTRHFGRLIISSGTKPLRLIFLSGLLALLLGFGFFSYAVYQWMTHRVPVQGWTSTFILISIFSGMILFTLGVVAKYLGEAMTMAMGKPLYLITSRCPRRAIKRR